jgi:hypothetical protein
MTRTEFATGSAAFLAVAVAGSVSTAWVDRHFVAASVAVPPVSSAACVGADGSWKNWVWANVPMLSPKCERNP